MNNGLATHKNKKQNALQNKKVLEQLGEISSETVTTAFNETKKIGMDALSQILGINAHEKRSGDINPGQSLNVSELLSKKDEENHELKKQIYFEKKLIEEIKSESQKKLNDLRLRLHALMGEAAKIAKSASNLSEETKIAVSQAPINPGEYHITYIQNLIEYIQTFRKKIDLAVDWLAESNHRKQKKNYWSMYKKKGASFLLSGESYSARSAG